MDKCKIKEIIDENVFWSYSLKKGNDEILINGVEMPCKFKINDFSLRLNGHMLMCIGKVFTTVYYFNKELSFYGDFTAKEFNISYVGNVIFQMETKDIEKFNIYL